MGDLKIGFGIDHQGSNKDQKNGEAHVDLSDENSIRRWSEVLHLTREELFEAVHSFGPLVRNIRIGLRQKRDQAA